MNCLIKIIIIIFISFKVNSNEDKSSKVFFTINEKVFTNIDFEKRIQYISLTNNFKSSELTEKEIDQIKDDYISSLIFYEYYDFNQVKFENLSFEIENIFKNISNNNSKIINTDVLNIKFNIKIDLVRKKIIEEELNKKKKILFDKVNNSDLLYNYNLSYITFEKKYIDNQNPINIKNRKEFNNFKEYLIDNKIIFFEKNQDIDDYRTISEYIKKLINEDLKIDYIYNNELLTIYSLEKNLESYQGVFVKLLSFKSDKPLSKKEITCSNLKNSLNKNKTTFKEYEYIKLNEKIKENLKEIHDYIVLKDNNILNYIVLCEMRYDEKLLNTINFNKMLDIMIKKIQTDFITKYKNEFNFKKF